MSLSLKQIEKIEILTLQDNYFDALMMDNNEIVNRALPIKDGEIKNTLLAEHGFAAKIDVIDQDKTCGLLFDFGFSEFGAAFNARALNVDFSNVEATVLSHGHLDHFGGMQQLTELIGKNNLDLFVHPAAFKSPRYMKISEQMQFGFPSLSREKVEEAGLSIVETTGPRLIMNDTVLLLGEIPKITEFEKGAPNLFFKDGDEEKLDPIEDDTAIVVDVARKGLVILSGCAHSGIVNTVEYARQLTGKTDVYAIMGGFHLTGPAMAPAIDPTVNALGKINPNHIIPTHCTGRSAIQALEQEMGNRFIVNMPGTKLTL